MMPLIFLAFGFVCGLFSMACLVIGKLFGDYAGHWFEIPWLSTVLRIVGVIAGILVQGGGAVLLLIPISMLQGTERKNKGLCAAAYAVGMIASIVLGVMYLRTHW
ncbi:hypothetical protein BH10PLA1_BH10PLA1_09710 [soil metagenome]